MNPTIHRAKFVFADPDLLLPNAAVHVSGGGRILRVGAWEGPGRARIRVIDWGSAVILPGLVNSHTHLELTRSRNLLDNPGSFTRWLERLIELCRPWTPAEYAESVRAGSRESLQLGTTLAGDISAGGMSTDTHGLRKVVFEEVLSLSADKVSETVVRLRARLAASPRDQLLSNGVSPHAPYTVSPELYREAAGLARRHGMPMATHVAETIAELDFLQSGGGEFRDFLTGIGALPPGWKPPGVPPIPFLDRLGVLQGNSVLIHCNYLDPESLSRIRKARCSVVYCPRSSAFFGHENHPVRKLLDLGINVALGTDSLASNGSLGMLDEMRFLSRTRRDLSATEILRMATSNGAAALGLGGRLGRLGRGCWADMTVLELPENAPGRNLAGQILEGMGECLGTVVQGNIAWSRAERV